MSYLSLQHAAWQSRKETVQQCHCLCATGCAQQKCAKKASNILWSSAGSLYATNIPIIRTPKIYQGLGGDVKKYAFTHVEDDNAIEDTVNCFGNIPTGAFGLRCSAVKRHALAWLVVKKVDPKTHIATNSIPWKEKAAWTSTDRIPRNLSVLIFLTRPAPATAPGCFQYWVGKLFRYYSQCSCCRIP